MIKIIRGTNATIAITFTKDGVAYNITGYTLMFTVKAPPSVKRPDVDAVIVKNITSHTDPTHGKTQIALSNEDTEIDAGEYFWDIRLLKDGTITSTYADSLEIAQNITARKSV